MQSFIAFCSLCLQLSNLLSQDAEFLLKRDQACTLCLTDILQPANIENFTAENKSSTDILNNGLYFNNPLLKEALRLKMEQQFLFQTNECPELDSEFASKGASQAQAEELFKTFVETVGKLPSTKAEIRQGLEEHRDSIHQKMKEKIELTRIIFQKATADIPNKPKMPGSLRNDFLPNLEKIMPEFQEKILPEQLESKLSGFSEQYLEDFQDLNQKIQNLKNKISSTQNIPDFEEITQEISFLYNQAVVKLEQQSKIQHQLDQDSIFEDLDQKLKKLIDPLLEYLKPIKTTLKAGERLGVNERISSESGIFSLVMQDDWTVALYKFSNVIWSSGKFSAPSRSSPQLFFDPQDGVIKIQSADASISRPLNPKNPNYSGNRAYLTITNSGEIKIFDSESGLKLWTPLYSLPAPTVFPYGFSPENVMVSENEIYTLALEKDCNLVLYEQSLPIWHRSALTESNKRRMYCRLSSLNSDGTLTPTSYSAGDRPIISPIRSSTGRASLIIKNNGVLVILKDQEVWTSKD